VYGSYGSTAPLGLLTILGELEALAGVVFLSIVKGKQAIAARRYGLLGLVLGVNLFLVLIVVYLFNTQGTFTLIGGPVARQIEQDTELLGLAAFLLPFAAVGMVLLSVGGSEISKRLWQFMLGGASLFCLLMAVFLVFFSVAVLYAWQQNQQLSVWYPVPEWMPWYPAAYVPVQVVWAGLLLSTVLALGALRSMVGAVVASSRARLASS
jgi:hypothetical protein